MADQPTPQKGDWISARRVKQGDGTDTVRDEGVVVGLPRKGNGGYYDILSPYEPAKPFQGHVDDAQVVPDEQLIGSEKRFRDEIRGQLNSDHHDG